MMPEFFLRIADITLAIRCRDSRIRCQIPDPVNRFLVTATSADVVLDVEHLDHFEPPAGRLLFESGSIWRMYDDPAGYRIDCFSAAISDRPYKVAIFDESFTRGTIRIDTTAFDTPIDPLGYPLDELLLSNLLARGRGVELHGCGVIDHAGRGHLFVGQSGAGKSTTAKLWGSEAREIVSDDRVVLREESGQIWMYGTPWHGEASISSPSRAPLSGVYLLVQAQENELRLLSNAVAVARLFACAFPPFHDANAVAFTMTMLERIALQTPVREFRFTLDRSAIDLVREAA